MTWVQLLSTLAVVLARQWGWLGTTFRMALDLAQQSTSLKMAFASAVPDGVTAAPSELTRAIMDFLNAAIDKVDSRLARLVLKRAVEAVPIVIDQLWDALFGKAMVGCAYADHPESPRTVQSAAFDDAVPAEILEEMTA